MSSQSFASIASIASLVAAALVAAASIAACSSSNNATPTCDDSKCAAGNKCLPLNGETKCRKTCSSNIDPQTNCPFGYTCVSQDPEPFCVQDNTQLTNTTAQKGQFGSSCNPTGGITNPDCDQAQGFYCFGESPTDASAYCTRMGDTACDTDRDCAATYYCGKINVAPNVQTTKRTIGQTTKACIKRTYCTPCTADLDCPTLEGHAQRCVPDSTGNNSFCSPECATNDNCNGEAKCVGFPKPDGTPDRVCFPRAGVCVGDGTVCAPCRSDDDCLQPGENPGDGICVHGQYYATEKFCAKKSKTPCATDGSGATCPKEFAAAKVKMYCLGGNSGFAPLVPPNYCHGLESFGSSDDLGCFTPPR